ncbi:sensor histidine kinase, partial [Streptomyces venezuelae]|uniref:sensor histidine kinase n=1 Tax=Streptomyces venezuelae TaxID=54571 RepID=UPI00278C431A
MSLGTALLILAFVPGVALVALWGVTSGQTFLDFQRQAGQGLLAEKAGQPSNLVYFNLQEERRLSAEALARRAGAADALAQQRVRTDEAVERFRELSDVGEDDAPPEVLDAVSAARDAIGQLPAQRTLVDGGDGDQQQAVYDYYTDLISVDLELFAALSRVDNGRITTLSQPLVDLFWVKEMVSRSDALLARAWHDRTLGPEELTAFRQAVSSQTFLTQSHIVPLLPAEEKAMWSAIVASPAWQTKTDVENAVLRPAAPVAGGAVSLPAGEARWRDAMDTLTPELESLLQHRTALVVEEGKGSVLSLLTRMAITTVVGLLAVLAVIWTTWRLTRTLRLRIGRLQEQAEALEKALPDVVERLGQGERIDVETEARAIRQDENDRASDELTRLGEAFNLARTSALEAAVRQADQHRGFERLLQRIARRTQQLIGQQLKKLDELERRHEDPEILDGLFDLDHLTARLRRYEENLVILAGGAPHRRWRKPVPLLDVMRSAQGEVQDYRRVLVDLDGAPWIAARAVGPVAHVLAELMENALVFSRPPSPVEIRAARVSHGLAVEIEDRGLGMEPEQLAEVNDLMARPPRMDLLAHSEDIRLGLQVVARLANQYGLRVEFRTSAYGGTRVVVLVPQEFVVEGPEPGPGPKAVTGREPAYGAGHASAHASGTPPYAHAQPHPDLEPHPVLGPQQDLAQAPAPASGSAPAAVAPEAPTSAPTPVIRPLLPSPPQPVGAEDGALPTRVQGRAMADVTALTGNHPDRHPHRHGRPEHAPPLDADPPLPRRVRQASLVDELKVTPDPAATPAAPLNWQDDPLLRPVPRRARAPIGAIQPRYPPPPPPPGHPAGAPPPPP